MLKIVGFVFFVPFVEAVAIGADEEIRAAIELTFVKVIPGFEKARQDAVAALLVPLVF